ncbi:MAG TPA: peptidoglycan bridge formation glycyltransferase FemA/FemB family protein [Actinomycetaceae bacterium]|nr:peptidoglycan bridge formation glycyltransferase FemA/FemB family protein [Actinomycetaceae bacterium]
MAHFLQSPAWARFQKALGREVVVRDGDGWHYLAVVEKGTLNSRLYCPYGPVITRPDALQSALDSLLAEAKKRRVAFVRIEPTGEVTSEELELAGAIRVESVQPDSTQRVKLDREWDEILKDFKATNRNLHRNYAKKGLSVRSTSNPADIEILLELLHGVAKHNQMNPQSDEYLRTQADSLIPQGDGMLYIADLEGEPIAASMIYDDGEVRYYSHAAADYEHRKLSAGTILVSQMMQDAAEAGRKEFDLYGVVSPDAPEDHPWRGFSEFKRGFGGYQHDYVGAWEIPVNKVVYRAYRFARSVVESDVTANVRTGVRGAMGKAKGAAERAKGLVRKVLRRS